VVCTGYACMSSMHVTVKYRYYRSLGTSTLRPSRLASSLPKLRTSDDKSQLPTQPFSTVRSSSYAENPGTTTRTGYGIDTSATQYRNTCQSGNAEDSIYLLGSVASIGAEKQNSSHTSTLLSPTSSLLSVASYLMPVEVPLGPMPDWITLGSLMTTQPYNKSCSHYDALINHLSTASRI
jgi:hypothetical protein